jgi:hypothetical protein
MARGDASARTSVTAEDDVELRRVKRSPWSDALEPTAEHRSAIPATASREPC